MFVSGFEDLNQVPGYCSEFSFVTCCFSARLSIGKISPLHASTAAESALLVNQILLPHLHKLLQPGHGVIHWLRQAYVHSAQVVDDLFEADEVELDEVIQADVGCLLDRVPEAAGTAGGEGGVELLYLARLSLLAGCAVLGCAFQDGYHRVPRKAEDHHMVGGGRDVHHHPGVGARPLGAAPADHAVFAGPAVRADQQNIERIAEAGRPLRQVGPDVDAVDAVPYIAVPGVGIQRAENEGRGQHDRQAAGDLHPARVPAASSGTTTAAAGRLLPVHGGRIVVSAHRSSAIDNL